MPVHIQHSRCVTILLPGGIVLGSGAVGLLIRYAQRHCGADTWGRIAVEQFCSAGETLLLAHPADPENVQLADYFLQFVHNNFKD